MDDIMKKFKELSFKEQLGIYAGLALLICSFLPFAGVDLGGLFGADAKLASLDLGFLAWIGGGAGAVLIFLKQPFLASVSFAAAALAVAWNVIDVMTTEYVGLKFGAFLCIAAAAVGVWATIDALISKAKESSASKSA